MKVSYNNTKHEYFGKIQKYNTTTAYIYNPYTDTVTIPSGHIPELTHIEVVC